ncbi:hypothetical protein, partial [Nocardia brasiliensis]|uniref:hypothetical protein n=1 Tax=Nocardia brasiliensis TaxID=37326 RepID=UPI0024583B32
MTDVEVARRIDDLSATDEVLAGALPDPAVDARIQDPAVGLAELIRIVFAAYGDRPAVGARAPPRGGARGNRRPPRELVAVYV